MFAFLKSLVRTDVSTIELKGDSYLKKGTEWTLTYFQKQLL